MSGRSTEQQGGPSEPQRLRNIEELTLPKSFHELSIPGFAEITYARERQLPPDGLIFVGMNSAAYTKITKGKIGQIYTIGLGGCTGVAGVANINSGALAGVSHFDAVVDAVQRQNGICASERFMHQFVRQARAFGARAIQFVAAYDDGQKRDPNYGKKGGNYDDWHYIDQLESFAEDAEDDVGITLRPYRGMRAGHTLVANVDRRSRASIEFR